MNIVNVKEITSGIDISKSKLDVCIMNHSGIIAQAEFTNDMSGVRKVLELLADNGCFDVAMESTGPYWYGVYDYLTEHNFRVMLVNPANAKSHIRNKSDKLDSASLAALLMLNQLQPSFVPDSGLRKLRRLTRMRAWLMDMKTAIKNQATAVVSTYSPELLSIFSDAFGKSGKALLARIAKGEQITGLSEEKIKQLQNVVDNAFPNLDPWAIQFTSSMISTIESKVKELDSAIASLVQSMPKIKKYVDLMLTITGVGLETAQAIAAEIADISRFPTPQKLIRYSGLNPTFYQSGSVKVYGKLEKAGPPHLRRALYQAAQVMAFFGPAEFRNYYIHLRDKFGSRGYTIAIVSLARKLLRVIWAMLTDDSEFIGQNATRVELKRKRLANRAKNFTPKIKLPELIIELRNNYPELFHTLTEL
ncbi:MAG: IS110 family transposase [Nitrososphaeria archaeon]